jgi:hypothetical protein
MCPIPALLTLDNHQAPDRLGKQECAFQVDIQDKIVILFGNFQARFTPIDASNID